MSLKALTDDEKSELKEQFTVLDKEESGFINLSELKEALDLAGFKVCLYIYTVSTQYLNSITQYLHSIYKVLHSIYTIYTQYYTISTQYLQSITRYLHSIYTVSTQYLHNIYSGAGMASARHDRQDRPGHGELPRQQRGGPAEALLRGVRGGEQ